MPKNKQLDWLIQLYLKQTPTMTLQEATSKAVLVLGVLDTTRVREYRKDVRERKHVYDFGMSIEDLSHTEPEN